MEIKHLLKNHAYQNIPLNFDEAYGLGVYALDGCHGDTLAQVQSIAVLSALHNRATYAWQWSKEAEAAHGHSVPRNSAEQIAGICAAVFELDIARSEAGFLQPAVPYAMDNCGMGGDLVVTANVSTIAALIAAAGGIPMCKHGSPANADNGHHGSSDFVSLLGIQTFASKRAVEHSLECCGFGYTEALDVRYKRIHLQTHEIAKLPHMNDIIGPMTNPLSPEIHTRRVLGLNHLISPALAAQAYRELNRRGYTRLERGLFIRGYVDGSGYQGVDEVSICPGGTLVAELRDDRINEYRLEAQDFGLAPVPVSSISPPKGLSKGEFSLAILKGEIAGPPLQMVLANAALLFYLADRSTDWRECYAMAESVFMSGKAYKTALKARDVLTK
ncbi:MAG TPA: hypothetical protein PLF71_02700 [bacterium]|nr:hypothetical protein [bacterium]